MKNIKKLLLVLGMLLCIANIAFAFDISFEWDANTEPDLAGYKLYRSATSGIYNKSTNLVGTIAAPTTTFTEQNVPEGVWYWVCTAYDTNGNESLYSNEVMWDGVSPIAPKYLRFVE